MNQVPDRGQRPAFHLCNLRRIKSAFWYKENENFIVHSDIILVLE